MRNARHTNRSENTPCEGVFCTGDLKLDFDKRILTVGGKYIHLTQNEYRIVTLLAKYAGKVLTYDYIIKSVWGPNIVPNNQILRVNMANIRRKIEKNPSSPEYILTETGVGYRMVEHNDSNERMYYG